MKTPGGTSEPFEGYDVVCMCSGRSERVGLRNEVASKEFNSCFQERVSSFFFKVSIHVSFMTSRHSLTHSAPDPDVNMCWVVNWNWWTGDFVLFFYMYLLYQFQKHCLLRHFVSL